MGVFRRFNVLFCFRFILFCTVFHLNCVRFIWKCSYFSPSAREFTTVSLLCKLYVWMYRMLESVESETQPLTVYVYHNPTLSPPSNIVFSLEMDSIYFLSQCEWNSVLFPFFRSLSLFHANTLCRVGLLLSMFVNGWCVVAFARCSSALVCL